MPVVGKKIQSGSGSSRYEVAMRAIRMANPEIPSPLVRVETAEWSGPKNLVHSAFRLACSCKRGDGAGARKSALAANLKMADLWLVLTRPGPSGIYPHAIPIPSSPSVPEARGETHSIY